VVIMHFDTLRIDSSSRVRVAVRHAVLSTVAMLIGCLLLYVISRGATFDGPDSAPPSSAASRHSTENKQAVRRIKAFGPEREPIQLCQALEACNSGARCGVECGGGCDGRELGWESARLIQWQRYAQGEYVGPARASHVSEYRLRVDDELDLVYRLTREEQPNPYQLNVGDEVRVESATDPDLDRDLILQPDGTITLRLLGQVRATGLTVTQLRDEIEKRYGKYYKVPAITVSPLRVNSKLDDLRNAVDARFGHGGQNRAARVTPDGTISLPAVGVVQAQGLTLQELRVELREAYRREVEGIEVIPVLVARAPRYVYVLGEVAVPGRYELTGPTTALQAIAMAGSWKVGAYLREIVVLRRNDNWQLMATKLDLRPALYGRQPCPPDEIWISDSDIIVVPKNPILVADEFIEMVFTRGIYGVFPMNATLNFAKVSSL
jgi:polysaccharide biosynthesis/export protein